MGKTYTNLSASISDVFESIVSTVESNLSTESSVAVSTINYHCETWVELQNRLIAESENPNTSGLRFPLVALIRNFDKDYKGNDGRFDSKLTLIIVTRSTATMLSEDRVTTNFIPTLRPIEEELFSVIRTSPYFSGYMSVRPPHTSYESYNLGLTDAKSYKLPEHLDGIIIDNLQLKFNPTLVDLYRQGPIKTLSYINNVSQITIQYVSGVFRIGLSEAQYTGLGTPTYTISTSHNSDYSTITVGGSKVVNVAGYTGEYYGSIQSNDGYTTAILYFFYKVVNGVVTKYTSFVEFRLQNFTLTGFATPYYPFEILTQTTVNKAILSNVILKTGVGIEPEVLETLETVNYTPSTANTTAIAYAESLPLLTDYRYIQMTVSLDTANNTTTDQVSTAYFKLT